MANGRVTVDVAFDRSGKHPGLTTDELYWIAGNLNYSMTLFKDGMACRDKHGDKIYVLCKPGDYINQHTPEMQLKEIKWLMGEL